MTLSGLTIDGVRDTGNPGNSGVYIVQGGTVSLCNMTITAAQHLRDRHWMANETPPQSTLSG